MGRPTKALSPEQVTKNVQYHYFKTAVREGKIVPPLLCDICKQEKHITRYHYKRDKPYDDITWFCEDCYKHFLKCVRMKAGIVSY